MNDSGINWWFENQIDWDVPIFICLDVWSTNFLVGECVEQELELTKLADSRPLVLYSSFSITPTNPNLESRFPGLEKVLSKKGYTKSDNLTNNLRLHSTTASFGLELSVFVPKSVAQQRIPLRMQLTGSALHLFRFLTNIKTGLKNHFLKRRHVTKLEQHTNQSRNHWRENAIKALYEKYEFIPSADEAENRRPEITFQNKKFTFYNTTFFRHPSQLTSTYNEAYFHVGKSEEVCFTISNEPQNQSEIAHQPLSFRVPKIIISTLVFNDFMFVEPWIAHYRKYGVTHFLIYFNHHSVPSILHELAEKNADITVIPWDVPYSHLDSKMGKWSFHVAQPMQLHHSVILSKARALGTHMLYIDIDEYIVGPTTLNKLINMDTDEIGFTNVWASSESVVDLISPKTLVDPEVDFTREPRKKSLRSLQLQGKWNIHGNAGQESIVTSHVMLHFGDIMKHEAGSNFFERGSEYEKKLQPISTLSDEHPLRKIFDRQL